MVRSDKHLQIYTHDEGKLLSKEGYKTNKLLKLYTKEHYHFCSFQNKEQRDSPPEVNTFKYKMFGR